MTKSYSENKFKALPAKRKAEVILHCLHTAEKQWTSGPDIYLQKAFNYFNWLDEQDADLNRISHLKSSLVNKLNLKSLYNLIVPFERLLERSPDDQAFVPVVTGDSVVAKDIQIPLYVVVDHFRSAFNVGSIFRTCESLGVKHLYLVGYTPTPEDSRVRKTSMNTHDFVSWSHFEELSEVIAELKTQDIKCIALETAPQAENIHTFIAPQPSALFLGNERFGFSQNSLAQMDHILYIPMVGQKNSLNVATAFGLTAFEFARQWKKNV